ncbi:hypothetical protein [Faucicola boevrei]|uniref:hypothetical protein n=1 Tax=Faucicola boevrei TaxID=346665 RepID=UPI0003658BE3|nr:hypothetical protein [Moraxella boevrei]
MSKIKHPYEKSKKVLQKIAVIPMAKTTNHLAKRFHKAGQNSIEPKDVLADSLYQPFN